MADATTPGPLPSPGVSRRRWLALARATALTAACGKRGSVAIVPPPPPAGAALQQVVVATSRRPVEAPVFFSNQRAFTTSFARFAVSIPPRPRPRHHPLSPRHARPPA
jgi:hypothetical protein